MRSSPPADDAPFAVPFAPPRSELKRRTIHAATRAAADRKVAAVRARMLEHGQRLVAASTREAAGGLTVELVFTART
jgi:hypothetical protein